MMLNRTLFSRSHSVTVIRDLTSGKQSDQLRRLQLRRPWGRSTPVHQQTGVRTWQLTVNHPALGQDPQCGGPYSPRQRHGDEVQASASGLVMDLRDP